MSIVSVFGGNSIVPGDAGYLEGLQVGRELALAGFTVATGGYGGVMEAVSRGAKEAGTHVIGVTTTIFVDQRLDPNAWVDEEIRLPTLFQRLHHLVTFSDALVALRGGVGTLSEVALAWSLLQVREISRRPLILVGPAWRQIMETFRRESTITGTEWQLLDFASTAADVVPLLRVALANGGAPGRQAAASQPPVPPR